MENREYEWKVRMRNEKMGFERGMTVVALTTESAIERARLALLDPYGLEVHDPLLWIAVEVKRGSFT